MQTTCHNDIRNIVHVTSSCQVLVTVEVVTTELHLLRTVFANSIFSSVLATE